MIVITFIGIIALAIATALTVNHFRKKEDAYIAVPVFWFGILFLFILSAFAIEQCEKQGIEKFANGEYTVEPNVKAVRKVKIY